jgi:hypothetical protein
MARSARDEATSQRRRGDAREKFSNASRAAVTAGATILVAEIGDPGGGAIAEATLSEVLRSSRLVIEVRSTVTETPLTGKSTRSEMTRTRCVPGPIFSRRNAPEASDRVLARHTPFLLSIKTSKSAASLSPTNTTPLTSQLCESG